METLERVFKSPEPQVNSDDKILIPQLSSHASTKQTPASEIFELLESRSVLICDDLHFLVLVALTLEDRSERWLHRTFNTLRLALQINKHANNKVNLEQLTAATLAHDFAMAFLPCEIINKKKKLNAKEQRLMRTHISSAADLIHRLGKWDEARKIILSHHEHIDGSGYPKGLSDLEICDGAKILAIVDAFTAQGKKNIMHGVMEINRHSGTHFSNYWLNHFNSAVKEIYQPPSKFQSIKS
ncbi:MAG: HD-GYP domain-containing protein (c-di-GMP phosphodiesterase class II) [Candidatus Azotimanducaceae bacterium]|jgi:HD-GYP domain-containing protein (c-di-GMP phosphodiesterase class II)